MSDVCTICLKSHLNYENHNCFQTSVMNSEILYSGRWMLMTPGSIRSPFSLSPRSRQYVPPKQASSLPNCAAPKPWRPHYEIYSFGNPEFFKLFINRSPTLLNCQSNRVDKSWTVPANAPQVHKCTKSHCTTYFNPWATPHNSTLNAIIIQLKELLLN